MKVFIGSVEVEIEEGYEEEVWEDEEEETHKVKAEKQGILASRDWDWD